jgi:hypothetical protein
MIQDSRSIPELESLEAPLRAWQQHPLYEQLTSLFADRIRELATTHGADTQPPPKTLTAHEARRVTKRMLRTGSVAELDAVVDRIRLRYAAGATRDDVENSARIRRERLSRITAAVDDPGFTPPPSDKRR